MKRCPECRRDYYDDTLSFCLEDGTPLVYGVSGDEPATAILSEPGAVATGFRSGEAPTRPQVHTTDQTAILPRGVESEPQNPGELSERQSLSANRAAKPQSHWNKLLAIFGIVILLLVGGFFGYNYFTPTKQIESITVNTPKPATTLYWQMPEAEQMQFISERARYVQTLLGDEPADLDQEALSAIKEQIDDYVEDKDSLSQKPFEEGLRAIYGRASQYAPLVIRSYEAQKVPAVLGLYQAIVESEYHDCPSINPHPGAPVGVFQFSRKTAAIYGLKPNDYCDVQKQCDAAARLMSDLISDFGSEKSSWTLALFSFNQGAEQVRDYLRQLRGRGITERSFWSVFRHQEDLQSPMTEEANRYVPRFFAAAIIGETPEAFELSTPPLTALRENKN